MIGNEYAVCNVEVIIVPTPVGGRMKCGHCEKCLVNCKTTYRCYEVSSGKIYLFFHLFHNYFLSTYYEPETVLNARVLGVTMTPSFIGLIG